ncbi:dynein axonemal assembly factor 19 [Osmia lignaria lignaria]|uniref:dynein axonemal assembly factor 19 n=1 Tax=Osmia lignaria lignaria TaxID=1437193 RepID=UPI0014791E2A|nr:coiled-coil domain-containing protein 103-like [Osmia lignaria]
MSKLKCVINYKSLELELQEALRADELYKLQNDTKIRAVEQNVPTYEAFRQMVLAAHLKPLQHSDIQPKMKGSWNPVVNNDNSSTTMLFDKLNKKHAKDCLKSLNNNNGTYKEEIPTTQEQFVQVWKTITTYKNKFNYLQSIRHILLDKIFRTEIPSTLLVEIINVCLQNLSDGNNVITTVDILNTLSKCNRFSLAVSFMGKDEREMCLRLFNKILINVDYKDEVLRDAIKKLGLIYEVTFE